MHLYFSVATTSFGVSRLIGEFVKHAWQILSRFANINPFVIAPVLLYYE
jgi:hypothetical protein